ncbi:MAG: response regulator transcription factor [Bernardetiaceae bacterium]
MPYYPTLRERQLLDALCDGYSNQEIADLLCCSLPTVEASLKKLKKAFRAKNRTHLAIIWFRLKWGKM